MWVDGTAPSVLDGMALGALDGASWGVGDLARELVGVGALALLLLFPGLALARARWTAVPFLSLSFWIASWWWIGAMGGGRRRFLLVLLAGFLVLAGLRLLKPWLAERPSVASLAVLGGAAALALPHVLEPVPFGSDSSFRALQALLLVWRDGMPSSYEPLLPAAGFGASPTGLAGLAADVTLLSGLPVYRATVLVSHAGCGLLALALFALLRSREEVAAAAGALVAVTSAVGLQLAMSPDSEVSWLASALVVASATIAGAGGAHRGLAAGVLLGAAMVTEPFVAVFGLAAMAVAKPGLVGRDEAGLSALLWGSVAAIIVAAPFLWTIAIGLAAGTVSFEGQASTTALAVMPVAIAGLVLPAMRRGRHASAETRRRYRRPVLGVALLASLATGAAAGVRRGGAQGVTGDDLQAMLWLVRHTRQSDAVCNTGEGGGPWIPGVAGRAVTRPRRAGPFPPVPQDRTRGSCQWIYTSGSGHGQSAFESGPVRILNARSADLQR